MSCSKIPSIMVTLLRLGRIHVITKETMIDFYKGKMSDDKGDKESANEDLESFLNRLRTEEHVKEEECVSYFLPKLSEHEVNLLEKSDEKYLKTFGWYYKGEDPDVDDDEMSKSESKSKFIRSLCVRYTFELTAPDFNSVTCCELQ